MSVMGGRRRASEHGPKYQVPGSRARTEGWGQVLNNAAIRHVGGGQRDRARSKATHAAGLHVVGGGEELHQITLRGRAEFGGSAERTRQDQRPDTR